MNPSLKIMISLKKEIEENSLKPRSNLELMFLSNNFEEGEHIFREFEVEALIRNDLSVPGCLLVTNKQIFFYERKQAYFNFMQFRYNEIDNFYQGHDASNKETGLVVVCTNGVSYVFLGLMRFGLRSLVEYVEDKIKDEKE